jgi:hypothetical protein
MVCICACKAGPQAPTPLTTINAAQGGKIVYGAVNGASTQAAAMSSVLRDVHNSCGEKPQIGKVFQFKGTNSVGVFFPVTDHQKGNTPVAGLVIAAATGPNQAEAALITDDASRFGQTVNPMLQQLFTAWHPGAAATNSSSASGTSGTASNGSSGPAPLHLYRAPDNTGTVGVPDGWKPQGQNGTFWVNKTVGTEDLEVVLLNLWKPALDPNNPNQIRLRRGGLGGPSSGELVYPSNANLVQAFPTVFKYFLAPKSASASVQVDKSELLPGPPGQRCIHATGHAAVTSKVPQEMNALLCAATPGPMGNYGYSLSVSMLPPQVADQERATAAAIMASFQPNEAVIARIAGQMSAPAIANIHAIGAAATARMNATEAANDAQHASWDASQNANDRNNQGFSNYLLDQSVVQDNNTGGHGTAWNSTAEALVKSNPNRFQYVDNPNYIKGTDY